MDTRQPLLKLEINDPRSDLRGFLVIDSFLNRIAVGGLRITPSVSMQEIENLARIMTLKFALLEIPFGGAKCGIVSKPEWTKEDRDKVLAAFGRAIKPYIEAGFFTGEDMGSSPGDILILHKSIGINQDLFLIQAALERGFKIQLPSQIESSKASEKETHLTGMGIFRAAEEALKFINKDIQGSTFSIQGFGSVGAGSAMELASRGAIIRAIADVEGTVFCETGLDIADLLAARNGNGIIQRHQLKKQVELLDRDAWLSTPVDVLIPAAICDAITEKNQNAVKARLVIEGANSPLTPAAEMSLWQRGVLTVPDFVANAGTAGGAVFLAGQAPLHPPTIRKIIGDRIAEATQYILVRGKSTHQLPRIMAEERAQKFLAAHANEQSSF